MFIKNNQEFTCLHCGEKVRAHKTSSRDHCTYCLYSLHIDINPGDRLNSCKGLLRPIGVQKKNGKTRIVYKCEQCREMIFNIVAEDDNQDLLVSLSNEIW